MELLAPVGNFESLKAAVSCGADAVYLGMERYGARADAGNFGSGELVRAVEFAHLRGVKVHVTANTLIKRNEMPDALKAVKFAYEAGADAFIVQDLGLISEIRNALPDAVLHASTQMGVCNAYGAALIKRLGLKRVVMARESLPEDIAAVKRETGLEIEFFCQGALCVAYSGNCYYSSLVSGCSGNRGRCLQLCRKKYTVGTNSGYFLSAKDICLLDKLELLKNAGVDSLKIEGRLRAPEYVAETVAVYRKAIDGISDPDATVRLKKVFNRGNYCTAYIASPTENVIYPKVQNNIGYKVGKVGSVLRGKAKLELNEPLQNGDGVKYLRNGLETGGGLIDGDPTGFSGDVKAGDDVCLTSSSQLKKSVSELDTRIPAEVKVNLCEKSGVSVTIGCKGRALTVKSDVPVMPAQSRAVTEKDIVDAVGSLGGTDFSLSNINVKIGENLFYPLSKIKELRKNAVQMLRDKLLRDNRAQHIAAEYIPPEIDWFAYSESDVFVAVSSAETLKKVKFDYNHVVLDPTDYSDYKKIETDCKKLNGTAVLNLPFVIRGKDAECIGKLYELPVKAVIANNVAHFELFRGKKVLCGIGLNILNPFFGKAHIDSIENDGCGNGIRYVYGKPPLMHFAHCPKRTQGGNCNGCNGYNLRIKDDKGAEFDIRRIKENYCYGVLAPVVPLANLKAGGKSVYIDLSYATSEEIEEVNKCLTSDKIYSLPCTHGNVNRKLQ